MDEELYRIACEVIDMDCTLTGKLRDGEGNFCAVGGLYTLLDPDWAIQADKGIFEETHAAYLAVAELFVVSDEIIYSANDRQRDLRKRREAVKLALREAMGG